MSERILITDIVSKIESANNPYAMRFEEGIFNKTSAPNYVQDIISNIRKANACSYGTARMIYFTSFGLFQIMGFNLYSGNAPLKMPVGKYLNDIDAQGKEFWRFLEAKKLGHMTASILAHDEAASIKFAITYNGGIKYAELIAKTCRDLGVK